MTLVIFYGNLTTWLKPVNILGFWALAQDMTHSIEQVIAIQLAVF